MRDDEEEGETVDARESISLGWTQRIEHQRTVTRGHDQRGRNVLTMASGVLKVGGDGERRYWASSLATQLGYIGSPGSLVDSLV
jgi:hypothetical protein